MTTMPKFHTSLYGKKRTGRHFLLFLTGLLVMSCQEKRTHPISFYHWKTHFSPTPADRHYFRELGCGKVYLRFFDVDTEQGEIQPKAILRSMEHTLPDARYVPVVFITNRTLPGLSGEAIAGVAEKILTLIGEIEEKNHLPAATEIQIDCDWTERTRENYFRLLTLLQEKSGRDITCTLRLHQIKFYKRTGVPPVCKGYLMCYATSDPADSSTPNSILDLDLLKDYTARIQHYPLDMDVALPLYSWAVVTNHLGKIRLINGITREDMDAERFRQVSDHLYEARDDLFFHGLYINKGFSVRVEEISPGLLQEARSYLDSQIKKDYAIVYYHLHEPFLTRFTLEQLR